MKRISLLVFAISTLVSLANGRVKAEEQKQKIAVLALKINTVLEKGIDKTLDEIILHEFQEVGNLQVLSSSDIFAILDMEVRRRKLGCSDNSCLAEIGGALGVPLMASSSIGAVGDRYVINLKIIDVSAAIVLARSSEIVPRDNRELIKAVKKSVASVIAGLGLKVKAAPAKQSRSIMDVAPWVSLSLAIAAGGAAATLAGLAHSDSMAASEEYEGTPAWQNSKDAFETKALSADVLFGIAGAAAVTTLVLFVVRSDDDEAKAPVSVSQTTGGGVATFSLRF